MNWTCSRVCLLVFFPGLQIGFFLCLVLTNRIGFVFKCKVINFLSNIEWGRMGYSALNNKLIFVTAILHTPGDGSWGWGTLACACWGHRLKMVPPWISHHLEAGFHLTQRSPVSIHQNPPASPFPALWSQVIPLFLAFPWVPGIRGQLPGLSSFAVAF